jgi:hypothetical protein
MGNVNLAPVPYQTPISGPQSIITGPWQAWFRQLTNIVLTASQVNATAAAAAAAASAAQAASSSSSAGGFSTAALGYSTTSATSSATAVTAASQAAASALAAAASAAAATGQGFAPYIISSTVTVPANFQMVAFQQITLLPGGRFQIFGRGRLL